MDEKKQDETLVNECDEMEEEAVDEGVWAEDLDTRQRPISC